MATFLPDLNSLPLAAQVAQMVVVRASGFLFDHQIRYPQWEPPAKTLRYWLETLGVGGVILLGGSASELALRTQQLQDWAKIPLLLAADVEEGVGQRFPGATWFPPPMALSAIAQHKPAQALYYAEQMGATIAKEAQAIGLNWLLTPTVDVNNNPKNPVINVRAFGETVEQVVRLTSAYIKGAKQHSVLTIAKHFPGHGDTAVDSHLELPVIPHSLKRLEQVELPPFQAAIAAGVDAIMTAHLQIPVLDPLYPATLSQPILTGLLRGTLGFNGLVVTDALIMGAIADRYGANESAVMAVEAGTDILLMPLNPEGAIQAVCQAVETGRIHPDQIRASVERIWQAKQRVCSPDLAGATSHTWESDTPIVEPQTLIGQLASPDSTALIDSILQDSLVVHQPESALLGELSNGRNLVLIDDALNSKEVGRHTPAIAMPAANGYQLQIIDGSTPAFAPVDVNNHQPTLLQLFIRDNPFRPSAKLTQIAQTWFDYLLNTNQLQAVVVYGSPYVLDRFLPHLPPTIPYVFTYGQMPQAQAIALRAIFRQ